MGKWIHDVEGEAKTMERFAFVALFVARCTARKANREVTGGLQLRKTPEGWIYGWAGGLDCCAPTTAAKVVDVIRRTALNHYVQEAEAFRIEACS